MKETIRETYDLDGILAMITDRNRGIGEGIVRGLTGAGACVVVGDIAIGAV